ncbi:MAG: glycosyltransferase [Actinomycetota bacterium]|nr:glycosyltransferase [Actinomycetota bacterium]
MPTVAPVTVVVITRDRLSVLLSTLERLAALPEAPPILVVDNGSENGASVAVREAFPQVEVVAAGKNLGAAGRNVGARHARTQLVAFSDDDSWWEPGALERAAELFAAHPRLALVAARILVNGREDPTCADMASSPLPEPFPLPGPPVLGFVACGAVVRREAFLAVGGFHPRIPVGGEERLLALDLVAAGWAAAYADDVVAHHSPPPRSDPSRRHRAIARSGLLTAWLRRPLPGAVTSTVHLTRRAPRTTLATVRDLPWVLRERRAVSRELDGAWSLVSSPSEGFPAARPRNQEAGRRGR